MIDPIPNSSSYRHVWQTVRRTIYEILRAKEKMHQLDHCNNSANSLACLGLQKKKNGSKTKPCKKQIYSGYLNVKVKNSTILRTKSAMPDRKPTNRSQLYQ